VPDGRRSRSGPIDRDLLRALPVLRRSVPASVVLGLVSTATVVVQAVALADLLASAMPDAHRVDRAAALAWLGGAIVVRALAVLGGEAVARVGAASAKAQLRRNLLPSALGLAAAGPGTSPGDVATIAGRGLDALDVYLGRCLPDLVLAAVAPVATVVAVGILDWPSAVILTVAIALFPVFGSLVGRASATLAAARWRQVELLARQVADVFGGLPVLRAFGHGAAQRERIRQVGDALRDASMATLRVAFLSALVLDTLASVSVALVAVPLGLRLLDGSVRLTAALAVLIIAPEVLLPLRRASAEFHESAEGLASWAAARTLLPRARSSPGGTAATRVSPPDPRRAPVSLRSVRVDLPGRDRPVLDGASLTITPGETVVLTGPNGAGKSTVISLLLGFTAPGDGTVTVGDVGLGDVDLARWRRHIAYLPEHPTLLAGSLADNLRLADPTAGDAELLDALARAGAPELADDLPRGLDTPIGDGGRPVSAGERQRIALARVLLRPASLYLLDEPTVHLDASAEATVLSSLRAVLAGKSALVVTHRPAPTAIADTVLRLDHGRFWPVGPADRPAPAPVGPVATEPPGPTAAICGATR
jgi:thiol reductant ABC exporter CydD subunit